MVIFHVNVLKDVILIRAFNTDKDDQWQPNREYEKTVTLEKAREIYNWQLDDGMIPVDSFHIPDLIRMWDEREVEEIA